MNSLCKSLDLSSVETSSVIRSLLTSLGQLKYLDENVMDQISNWFRKHSDKISNRDLISFLLSTASLNYIPSDSEEIYKVINYYGLGPRQWLTWWISVNQRKNHLRIVTKRGKQWVALAERCLVSLRFGQTQFYTNRISFIFRLLQQIAV